MDNLIIALLIVIGISTISAITIEIACKIIDKEYEKQRRDK